MAAKKSEAVMPSVWYFPNPDPNFWTACDWNPVQEEYNKNCRKVPKTGEAKNLNSAVKRVMTAIEKPIF